MPDLGRGEKESSREQEPGKGKQNATTIMLSIGIPVRVLALQLLQLARFTTWSVLGKRRSGATLQEVDFTISLI